MKGKKCKKLTSLLLAVLILLAYMTVPVGAAETLYRYVGEVESGRNYAAILGVREWDGSALSGPVISTYCVDNTIYTDPSADYRLIDLTDGNVRAILINSYPNVSLGALEAAAGIAAGTLTNSYAITATQFAIWHFTNGYTPAPGEFYPEEAALYNYLTGLSPVSSSAVAPATAAITSVTETVLPNGDAEIVIVYPAYASGTNGNGTPIPLSISYGIDIAATYPGASVVPATDGTTNTVTITVPAAEFLADISFTVTVSGIQTISDYYVFESVVEREDAQPLVGFISRSFNVSDTENADVEYESGSIVITKIIQGRTEDMTSFEVQITGPNEYTNTVSISQNAPLTLTGLDFGTYTLTEGNVAGYHTVSANPVQVTLSEENRNGNVTFTNSADPVIVYGFITVTKEVSNVEGDPTEFEIVINDVFKLYVKDGESASMYVPLGTYNVVETPVDGYRNVSITPSTFSLTPDGQTITVVNEKIETPPPPKGEIRISKNFEDGITDDTEFTVNISGPDGYSNSVKIKQGQVTVVSDLGLGGYTVAEEPLEGYVTIGETSFAIVLDEDNLSADVGFINGLEEIIIPPDSPPGDLPETGGAGNSGYFSFGSLVVLVGAMLLLITKRKSEICI